MQLILAIEPDLRQAAIVKRIVREKALAEVAVVDSRDAALEAMRTTIPDVLLLSALMSPRDEDELVAHLRTLEHADHLQTHTIPQLASALGPTEIRGPRGLLSAFRWKKEPEAAPAGCDPDLFAEEIRVFLQRAADKKRERANASPDAPSTDTAWRTAQPPKTAFTATDGDPVAPADGSSPSSWSSPFEWKPSSNLVSPMADPDSSVADPEALIALHDSSLANPESVVTTTDSLMAHLRPPAPVTTVDDLAVAVPAAAPVLAVTPVEAAGPDGEPPLLAAPVQGSAPVQSSGSKRESGILDSRSMIPDSGLGIREERSGIKDARLGALASWVRSESRGRDAAAGGDDLRGLLTGLAVPTAVVAVGYGRGCRIRRVRVPAAREPDETDSVGAVIVSKRLLAEQRERREQPQT